MTDVQLLALLDVMDGSPRLVVGNRKYVVTERHVIVSTRVGSGDRWAFAPSRDVISLQAFITDDVWYAHPSEARTFVHRAVVFNPAAHGRAMGARTL